MLNLLGTEERSVDLYNHSLDFSISVPVIWIGHSSKLYSVFDIISTTYMHLVETAHKWESIFLYLYKYIKGTEIRLSCTTVGNFNSLPNL
jgi:hypothetical protein